MQTIAVSHIVYCNPFALRIVNHLRCSYYVVNHSYFRYCSTVKTALKLSCRPKYITGFSSAIKYHSGTLQPGTAMSYEEMGFDDKVMRVLGPKARPLGFDVSESIINNQ